MRKGFLIAVGAILVLILLAVGVVRSLINRPTEIEEQITLASSEPSSGDKYEVLSEEVEGKLLVITEENGSKLVEFAAEFEGIPVKGRIERIEFVTDRILVIIDGEIYGFKTKLAIAAAIVLEDGKPRILVEDIGIGKLPLPASTKEKLKALANQRLEGLVPDLPLKLEDIRITEGQLIIQAASP